jgi:kynurenine formamidase
MKLVDLSHPLGITTPRSSDHPEVQFPVLRHYATHGVMTREVRASLHSGTHVDAPSLYYQQGLTVDALPLESFCGPAEVMDLSDLGEWGVITADVLDKVGSGLRPGDIAGLYTGWGEYYFTNEEKYVLKSPGLDKSGVDWMIQHEVKAIFSDTPSSEHVFMRARQWRQLRPDIFDEAKFAEADFPRSYGHKQLLPAGIMLVENVSHALGDFVGTRPVLMALPIKYDGVEGAPTRAVAITEFP